MANIPGAVTDPSRIKSAEIHFKSGTDSIPGYLAQPAQPGSYPGIVVIHDAFGLVDHIRDVARRFANIGYNALAPDLYARAGGPNRAADRTYTVAVTSGQIGISLIPVLDNPTISAIQIQ